MLLDTVMLHFSKRKRLAHHGTTYVAYYESSITTAADTSAHGTTALKYLTLHLNPAWLAAAGIVIRGVLLLVTRA